MILKLNLMKGVFFFCALVLVSLEVAKADLIPNPTRGKGIVPGDSLKVRMVSEQVRVIYTKIIRRWNVSSRCVISMKPRMLKLGSR